MQSLRSMTIEETYELSHAILERDMDGVCKELGDLLLHIVFYSQIASESGGFTIDDVITALCSKLIYRHPHVFGGSKAESAADVVRQWEKIKLTEKGAHGALGGVPHGLPAVVKAYRIQDKARAVGFDWRQRQDVWDKVKEEIAELEQELCSGDAPAQSRQDEMGDVLFSLINAARLYGIDPETALERANRKFISRFNYIEKSASEQGRQLAELTLEEMEALWQNAKEMEKAQGGENE